MNKWWKVAISIKLLAIISYVAYDLGWVHVGERLSFAETKADEPSPSTPSEAKIPKNPKSTVTAADVDADGYQDAEPAKAARKSFLDELFDVPTIDTATASKEEMMKYRTLVDKKKQQVDERLSMLQAREERLIDIEKSIDDKLVKMEEEKRYFLDTVQKEKQMTEERTKQLVEFYKKMAPKVAAPLFEKLDRDLVVTLFNNLPQKQVTLILGLMTPEASVKLTEYYGRIRSGREYELLKEINKSLTDEFQNCKGMKTP